MKRILLVGMTGGIGGVETFITNLLNRINRDEFKIDVLIFQKVNGKYEDDLENAYAVRHVHSFKKHPIRSFVDVFKLFRNNKYDIVHVNECTAKLFVYCWPVLFQRKIKLIIHSHNGNGKSIFHRLINPIQQLAASDRWSCSDEASRWMFGRNYKKKYNVVSVHNGIDVNEYLFSKKTREEYRDRFSITKGTWVIGCVARLEKQKNHLFLLDIFKKLLVKNPKSLLVLVGNGSLESDITKKARNIGVLNKVIFLGARSDVNCLLQMFDVLVMPSLFEGLPFSGIEAQAAGLPLVISKNVDHQIAITKNVNFEDLDDTAAQWAKNIETSLSARLNKRMDYKIVNKDFIAQKYDLNDTVKKIESLYESI